MHSSRAVYAVCAKFWHEQPCACAGTLQNPHFDVSRYVKQYAFELDAFQATSVACLVRPSPAVPRPAVHLRRCA
jgi:superfamily II RNA helicase